MINLAYANYYKSGEYSTELWVGAISLLLLGFLVGYLLGKSQQSAAPKPVKKSKK